MIEMSCNQRDVDVARLADGLAIVHSLEHGEQARMFLEQAREGVEITGSAMPAQRLPFRKRLARRAHRGIHVGRASLRNPGERPGGSWIDGLEILVFLGLHPVIVDEQLKLTVMLLEPFQSTGRAFGSRSVLQGLEDLGDFVHQAMG